MKHTAKDNQFAAGLYVLTGNATLGVFDSTQQFHVDRKLSAAFAEHNAAFLKSYLKNPGDDECFIGIAYTSRDDVATGELTVVMTESVVRTVYPTKGRKPAELTAFQRRSQRQKIYPGMEAILGLADTASKSAIFCPVLFDRHTMLDKYLSLIRRDERETDKQTPVLEVLNLAATIPDTSRDQPAVVELRNKLRDNLIKNELRQSSRLTVLDKNEWQNVKAGPAEYVDVDKRQDRRTDISAIDANKLHAEDHHGEIERWLPQPPRPIDSSGLIEFLQFKDLDETQLQILTRKCLIYEAPAGTRLVQRGMTDKWNLYLIEGSVTLDPADGAVLVVEGGTRKAENPLSFLKPRKYTIDTLTPVKFLWIHDELLSAAMSSS